jgi:hypothetical protein
VFRLDKSCGTILAMQKLGILSWGFSKLAFSHLCKNQGVENVVQA